MDSELPLVVRIGTVDRGEKGSKNGGIADRGAKGNRGGKRVGESRGGRE